ncbi:MAG: 7-cyano-7-deazaguanine synthase QueC [Abitibacteriaceae bacterium]|nr:7-cyano-7-deazaguanine synthase QueC [Abditibacteriaceae bacterium]MBV9865200.1 7-cyano-7-deazaguanine synthase QueC [Abditibacteriaceae bacterium]
MPKAIAIVSGGLDSVTLAYLLHSENYDLHLLAFNYGQRHAKEIDYARRCAHRLDAEFDIVDLAALGQLLKGSALTDDIAIPHGHYTAPSMAVTVVPNRNAIMLSIAYGVAVAENAEVVATGVHAGDHPIYPDCRLAFIDSFNMMQRVAVEGYGNPNLRLHAPFVQIGKHDIVAIGARLGVPFEDTWSCYEGGDVHCGQCGTCVERRESFTLAGVPDPTAYQS